MAAVGMAWFGHLSARNRGSAMASCKTCGEKAGIARDECGACRSVREEREAEQRAQRAKEAKERERERLEKEARELEERIGSFVTGCVQQMEQAHQLGLTPSLIQYRSMSTSYSIQGQPGGEAPKFSTLIAELALGWEIIATVPHTEGVALTNRTGNGNTIYAGGIGGMVTAIYVVLRLPVTPILLEHNRQYVEAVLRAQYQDGVSSIPPGGLLSIDSGKKVGGMSGAAQLAVGAAAGMVIGSTISDIAGMADGGVDAGFDGGDGGGDFGGFDF